MFKEVRQAHNIQPGQAMMLFDLDDVFVLSPQPSQVDALADRGKTLASMRQTLDELQGEHT